MNTLKLYLMHVRLATNLSYPIAEHLELNCGFVHRCFHLKEMISFLMRNQMKRIE